MLLLALDTSGPSGSVAVLKDDQVLSESCWSGATSHTTELPLQVQNILAMASKTLDQVEAFAVTTGPGSFTGIRVGLSFIKGLTFAARRPVVGVSTLLGLAMAVPDGEYICPLIDARREEVYGALFRRLEALQRQGLVPSVILEERAVRPRAFLEQIRAELGSSLSPSFLGSGAEAYRQEILDVFSDKAIILNEKFKEVRASFVGRAAYLKMKGGSFSKGAIDLLPHYLRLSEAELQRRP